MRNHRFHDEPVGHPLRGAPFGEKLDPATLTIGTVLSGIGAASTAISAIGALTKKGPSVATPTPTKTAVMPEPDDAAARAAKRRSAASQAARQGRQSTILDDSTTSDVLG